MRDAEKQMLADHYLDLYQIAFSILHNETDVEDAVQEALVVTMTQKLWGDPLKYCVGVLRKICMRMMTRNKEVLLDTMFEVPNPEPDPNSKRVQQLMDVIDTLPQRIRDILYLYYEKGYTKADIAREKGISESMVKKLFQKGQDILREQMIEIDKNDKDIFKP